MAKRWEQNYRLQARERRREIAEAAGALPDETRQRARDAASAAMHEALQSAAKRLAAKDRANGDTGR